MTLQKVTFKTQYQTNVAGNLFLPKNLDQASKNPAIIVGHPWVRSRNRARIFMPPDGRTGFCRDVHRSAFLGRKRRTIAQSGFSGSLCRSLQRQRRFLGSHAFVDRTNIGAIGVCGSGSFVISAAKIDPRIKAVATVSMYDMGAAFRDALNKSQTVEQRKQFIATAAEQRWAEADGSNIQYIGGTTLELAADTDPIQREFYDFYRTPRGEFTPEGVARETTTKPTLSSSVKFMNFYPFNDIETISRPMLFISGDQAHSKEFSKDAYNRASEPKELVWVKGAGHVDLYDRVDLIPFDKLKGFFDQHLA